ncbi:MAG: hypothetical protein NTW86_07625 [Candidatus Sumerlaeota bacterium]|nr:hypothetical protein [Candidatus Sumerlaeota bacterium]
MKTTAISQKSTDLAQKVISKELEEALNRGFKALRAANLQVKLQSRSDRGKALHKLNLNVPQAKTPKDILSEEEQRAIAIGSFLAEVNMGGGTGGIVFDDPTRREPAVPHLRGLRAGGPARAPSCVVLELGPLPYPGIFARAPRYYGPLRHPTRSSLALTGRRLESAPPRRMGLPVLPLVPLCIHVAVNTPAEPPTASIARLKPSRSRRRRRPSPIESRAGFRIAVFEACSTFARVATCMLAESPKSLSQNPCSGVDWYRNLLVPVDDPVPVEVIRCPAPFLAMTVCRT